MFPRLGWYQLSALTKSDRHKDLSLLEEHQQIWRDYYAKALRRRHLPRTELAAKLNESRTRVAIDCGCGTGSDIHYLAELGYQVHGFDIKSDSISICRERFANQALVELYQTSFESFDYPKSGLIIANNSLFFANPDSFFDTWLRITDSLEIGGVFAGDFMGINDSWASGYRSATTPLNETQVRELFRQFEIVRFVERDEQGQTALGRIKHWHTFSVVAVKRGIGG